MLIERVRSQTNSGGTSQMPHFARMFFVSFLLTATGCSQLAQKEEEDRNKVGRQLAEAYYSCVRTSFASHRPTMVDRNMAIEQAFTVCKTEEKKLHAPRSTSSRSSRNLANARVALVTAQRDRVVASYTALAATGVLSPQVLALKIEVYDPVVQQVRDVWGGVPMVRMSPTTRSMA
jgi:hypothetical protein